MKHYDSLFTEKTIGEFFAGLVETQPDHPFIMYADRGLVWSYKDFDKRTDDMAKGLLAIGVRKGDHVGVWARNVPEWLTLMFATAKIGAVLVTINTNYKSHELEYLVKQSDMHTLAIVDGLRDVNYVDVMYELVPELRTLPRGHLKSERFPRLKNVVYLGQEKHRGMYSSMELFQLGDSQNDEQLQKAKTGISNNDVVNMQYTSGTTGFPKGVMLTHRNILNNGYYIGERQKLTNEDRVCLPVPLFHCFGCVLGIMAILSHGATAVMVENFDPLIVLASIQHTKATAVYGVPTMYIAELNHPMFNMFDLSSLRTGIISGAVCPVDVVKQCIEKMHMAQITIPYGLTEAAPVFTMSDADEPSFEKRTETVGQGQPFIEIKIVDPETGKIVPPNTPGELCCRGYNVMKGYYNMPKETAAAIDEEGWLHSGDLGTVDEDGYYRITGRLKDMIIRGGENIYPREIEEFLRTNKDIQDVEVVGIPDQRYGEVVGAFVIPMPGATLTEDILRDYCRNKIAFYKTPKHFFVVKEFPQTASGKIQKFKLRQMAKELLGITDEIFNNAKKS